MSLFHVGQRSDDDYWEDVQLPARILVIEDNPANMELMVYLLKAYGHDPVCAHNGREGIDMARDTSPDLVICDIHLPLIDGYGVCDFVKGHTALHAIPIIAVTALAMVGDQEKLIEAGFNGYISKPIDPESFVPLIERFLPRERQARKQEQSGTPAGEE